MTSSLRSIAGRARRAGRLGWRAISRPELPADHQPLFILGHQKAGTSVIAALLGEYTGLAATIDLKQEIRDLLIPRIMRGEASVDELIVRNLDEFSVPIVKHPNLTLIFPQLRERFPRSQFAFVVRDPRDNIRSIFDRLDLSGTEPISDEQWQRVSLPWRLILGEGQPGWSRSDAATAVAHRWVAMARTYLDHADEMALIRYEDFRRDKVGAIKRLAGELGLPHASDIAASVDRQHQSRGAHRSVAPADFFGGETVAAIEQICAAEMAALDYPMEAHGE